MQPQATSLLSRCGAGRWLRPAGSIASAASTAAKIASKSDACRFGAEPEISTPWAVAPMRDRAAAVGVGAGTMVEAEAEDDDGEEREEEKHPSAGRGRGSLEHPRLSPAAVEKPDEPQQQPAPAGAASTASAGAASGDDGNSPAAHAVSAAVHTGQAAELAPILLAVGCDRRAPSTSAVNAEHAGE